MQSSLDYFSLLNGLIGGLALFLYGMHRLTGALRMAAGDDMQRILARLTTNRVSAAAGGALVTAVVQSSSVTTVMVVSFVSAGALSFTQSIGVIIGANVGTTITAQIIAFKVTSLAAAMIAGGLLLETLGRRSRLRHLGTVIMGLGLLFFGMNLMGEATLPLRDYTPFIGLMRDLQEPLQALLAAALFTALVQSSSATTGIVIVFATQGFLTLEGAIALILGTNIGTCITALLSAIGRPREAVKAALVHVIFNAGGALLVVGFIPQFADVARFVTAPGQATVDTALLPRQIANAHTLFNLGASLLFLFFTDALAAAVERLVPRPRGAPRDPATPRYLQAMYLQQPGIALDRARLELLRLGERVKRSLRRGMRRARGGDGDSLARLRAEIGVAGRLHESIVDYLGRLSLQELQPGQAQRLERYLSAADYLESLRELIAHGFIVEGRHRLQRGTAYPAALDAQLAALDREAETALAGALQTLASHDVDSSRDVVESKADLYRPAQALRLRLGRQLPAQGRPGLTLYLSALEHIDNLKRAHMLARRLARLYLDGDRESGSDPLPSAGDPGAGAGTARAG